MLTLQYKSAVWCDDIYSTLSRDYQARSGQRYSKIYTVGVTHTQKGGGVQIQTLGSDPKNPPTNLSQIK